MGCEEQNDLHESYLGIMSFSGQDHREWSRLESNQTLIKVILQLQKEMLRNWTPGNLSGLNKKRGKTSPVRSWTLVSVFFPSNVFFFSWVCVHVFTLSIAFTIWLALWASLEGQPEEETVTNFNNKHCRNANRREFPRLKNLHVV